MDVVVKLASTDREIPGFYVSGIDQNESENGASNVMALGGGEACHPVAVVALRKALAEFAAARARIAFFHGPLSIAQRIAPDGYLDEFRDNFAPARRRTVARLQSLSDWSKLSFATGPRKYGAGSSRREIGSISPTCRLNPNRSMTTKAALLNFVVEKLRADDLDVLVADFSPPKFGCFLGESYRARPRSRNAVLWSHRRAQRGAVGRNRARGRADFGGHRRV